MQASHQDPHEELERLHERWAEATSATEEAWDALIADTQNQELRDEYYSKQEISIASCQSVLEHKRKFGI